MKPGRRRTSASAEQAPAVETLLFHNAISDKGGTIISTKLQGFSDDSEEAYAAVVYLRTVYDSGPPTVSLVAAKTTVERQTIPRLELCGAQLLAKFTIVQTALNNDLDHTHAWSYSTIVLYWLDGSLKRFKTFVGNKVSAILNQLPARTWKHVPTFTYPADCASRWLLPQDLIIHSLRWKSPPWLLTDLP